MPDRFVIDAADPSKLCAVYSTQATAFVAGAGAEYLAACMEQSHMRGPKLKQPIRVAGLQAKSVSDYRVRGVYGLRVAPPSITSVRTQPEAKTQNENQPPGEAMPEGEPAPAAESDW